MLGADSVGPAASCCAARSDAAQGVPSGGGAGAGCAASPSECRRALDEPPMVAILVKAGAPSFEILKDGAFQDFGLVAEAKLKFFGEECGLWLVSPVRWPRLRHEPVGLTLVELQVVVESTVRASGWLFRTEASYWPVQTSGLPLAIKDIHDLFLVTKRDLPWYRRVLNFLHITMPTWAENSFLMVVRDHIGPDHALVYQRMCLSVQQLWLLSLACSVALVSGAYPPDGQSPPGASRVGWEIFKAVACLWTMAQPAMAHFLAPNKEGSCHAHTPDAKPPATSPIASEDSPEQAPEAQWSPRESPRRPPRKPSDMMQDVTSSMYAVTFMLEANDHAPKERWKQRLCRLGQIPLCLGVIWAFFLLVQSVFLWSVELSLYLIYSWAGCGASNPPCFSADGPGDRNVPWGTVAEIAADVGLAILFEIFTPTSTALGKWLVKLGNHRFAAQTMCACNAVALVLATLERVGFLFILAVVLAPEWDAPDGGMMHTGNIDMCYNRDLLLRMAMLDNASFACFRGHLPYSHRLRFFARLVKGPFMVAPFVSVLMKIIVPWLVERLDLFCRTCTCGSFLEPLVDGFWRLAAFIFVFDNDSVGGLRFVLRGWPYSDVRVRWGPQAKGRAGMVEGVVDALAWRHCSERRRGGGSSNTLEGDGGGVVEDGFGSNAALQRGVMHILQQGARKPYETPSEMLQMQMSLIMVSFFVASSWFGMIGVFLTLLAKWIEAKAVVVKMVFVRRRAFPRCDHSLRRTFAAFTLALAVAVPAWTILLSLVTYNEELYAWGGSFSAAWVDAPKYLLYRLCMSWFGLCALVFVIWGGGVVTSHKLLSLCVLFPLFCIAMNPPHQVGTFDHR